MSNETNETIADIINEKRTTAREIRSGTPNQYGLELAAMLEAEADRIEAAWKREREAGADAAQICGEIGEMIGREAACKQCKRLGNAAKMREALSGLLEIVCIDCNSSYKVDCKCIKCPRVVAAEAALSAPPRNCDRFINAKDAIKAFVRETGETMAFEFIKWLFAEAKGGAE